MSTPYPDSVRFLYGLGNEFRTLKLGLDRISLLLDRLGNPQRACRFVHVAGTNGKGSTCAMIERALREDGVRTGLYTSPHLSEPTERVRISGEPVSIEAFTRAFEQVHRIAEDMVAKGDIDHHPTYFETMTAMAYLLFRDLGAQTVVLETGMGGRLDATNVVEPLLSVITPIDFDHEKFLGDTIPKIAAEKAGILKAGCPAVFSTQRPEAFAVLERRARELGIPLFHAGDWLAEDLHLDAYGGRFLAVHGDEQFPIECPLIGAHQIENALTAIAALRALGVRRQSIQSGIAKTRWHGRLELVRRSPDWFLDGAHNPAGASALAHYIRQFHGGRRVWMIFGAMQDKDLSVIAPQIFPLATELIFTTPNQPRAFEAAQIRDLTGETRARVIPSPAEALKAAEAASSSDVVFVTGSLYLVGEARALLMPE